MALQMNSNLCATTIVVRLMHMLLSEAWMLRSVCVSRADVACSEKNEERDTTH